MAISSVIEESEDNASKSQAVEQVSYLNECMSCGHRNECGPSDFRGKKEWPFLIRPGHSVACSQMDLDRNKSAVVDFLVYQT